MIATEPNQALSLATSISEAGAKIKAVGSPTKSKALEKVTCKKIIIGDFEGVERKPKEADMLISNFHGERIAHDLHKALRV